MTAIDLDYRQRFFVQHSPVRGDVVKLGKAFEVIATQKNYPKAICALLGELVVAASLLMGTTKIEGRLSIQLQGSGQTPLHWAMAECDHTGQVRGLAHFDDGDVWHNLSLADEAFGQIDGVLFISIHPNNGDSYQGIVERVSDNLSACLAHYQKQSAQIDTFIRLATQDNTASGLLIQLLPQTASDIDDDPDLWHRISLLASTIQDNELNNLSANDILYRLYHDENVVTPPAVPLYFGCSCSKEKSARAIVQLGKQEALNALNAGQLSLECGFCGTSHLFDHQDIERIFNSDELSV